MQQVLLIVMGMRQGVLFRQPVIFFHQRGQAQSYGVEQGRLVGKLAMQGIKVLNKLA
ncbi:Uncharacterised protein [Klebsiella grimontii]|uniref:Uncharacterized protein n=1 Tax=Klebsiella grimontii TaxID=2058152 RepID=A0A7H4P290_9ENTR|nr:Uncharacterised protein [Klebsiella grimontii]